MVSVASSAACSSLRAWGRFSKLKHFGFELDFFVAGCFFEFPHQRAHLFTEGIFFGGEGLALGLQAADLLVKYQQGIHVGGAVFVGRAKAVFFGVRSQVVEVDHGADGNPGEAWGVRCRVVSAALQPRGERDK